jgi:hypothetical protein
MKDLEEQHVCVCVKFCFKLWKTATETWKMLQQAFGDKCMSQTQCFEWYSRFKTGRTSIDEDPRSGRPSTSTDDAHIDAVRDLILQNRRLTIREIAEDQLWIMPSNFDRKTQHASRTRKIRAPAC